MRWLQICKIFCKICPQAVAKPFAKAGWDASRQAARWHFRPVSGGRGQLIKMDMSNATHGKPKYELVIVSILIWCLSKFCLGSRVAKQRIGTFKHAPWTNSRKQNRCGHLPNNVGCPSETHGEPMLILVKLIFLCDCIILDLDKSHLIPTFAKISHSLETEWSKLHFLRFYIAQENARREDMWRSCLLPVHVHNTLRLQKM